MSSTKTYLLTLLLLALSGTIWTLARYGNNELRIVMLVVVLLICGVINLLQFIPLRYNLSVIIPGIITSVVFLYAVQGSNTERMFFSSIGIINGLCCGLIMLINNLRRWFV